VCLAPPSDFVQNLQNKENIRNQKQKEKHLISERQSSMNITLEENKICLA
jgi:hypothetical protein